MCNVHQNGKMHTPSWCSTVCILMNLYIINKCETTAAIYSAGMVGQTHCIHITLLELVRAETCIPMSAWDIAITKENPPIHHAGVSIPTVQQAAWPATGISVWQHVKCSKPICPWDTLCILLGCSSNQECVLLQLITNQWQVTTVTGG